MAGSASLVPEVSEEMPMRVVVAKGRVRRARSDEDVNAMARKRVAIAARSGRSAGCRRGAMIARCVRSRWQARIAIEPVEIGVIAEFKTKRKNYIELPAAIVSRMAEV